MWTVKIFLFFKFNFSSPKSNLILLNMIFILESTIKRTIVKSYIFYFICIQKEKTFCPNVTCFFGSYLGKIFRMLWSLNPACYTIKFLYRHHNADAHLKYVPFVQISPVPAVALPLGQRKIPRKSAESPERKE